MDKLMLFSIHIIKSKNVVWFLSLFIMMLSRKTPELSYATCIMFTTWKYGGRFETQRLGIWQVLEKCTENVIFKDHKKFVCIHVQATTEVATALRKYLHVISTHQTCKPVIILVVHCPRIEYRCVIRRPT